MELFTTNMEHLSPELKTQLENGIDVSQNGFSLVYARNGSPSLKGAQNGHETWLHSGYNPEVEGERWAEKVELSRGKIVVVIGFGLGYHVESLVEKAKEVEDIKVIVIEPVLAQFKMAVENRDYTSLFSTPFLHLIVSDKEAEIHGELRKHIRIGQFKDVEFQYFYPLFNYFPAYRETLKHIKSFLNSSFIDRNTYVQRGFLWTNNTLKNFPYLLKSNSLSDFKGAFKDIPAILVSAGPSLDKNVHLLNKAKGKALIVALGTSLKPVLDQGVKPDFVFHIDSGKNAIKNYNDIDVNILKKLRLIYVPELNPEVTPLFGDNLYLGMSPYSLEWLKDVFTELPEDFHSGPSVANYAFDYLIKTGANPIVLIGQDLAISGEYSHAKGTIHENKLKSSQKRNLVEVEDIYGNNVKTRRDMYAMLSWFNKYITNLPSDKKIIDATEGGARISGTEILTFQESIDKYCNEEVSIDEVIGRLCQNSSKTALSRDDLLEIIDQTLRECEEVQVTSRKGQEKSLQFQAKVARGTYAGKKLQKVFDDMRELHKTVNQKEKYVKMSSLMFQVINRVFDEGRLIANREEKFTREQGLSIAKSYQFYFTQVEEMAQISIGFLDEIKDNL